MSTPKCGILILEDKNMKNNSFGRMLAYYRKLNDLTQKQLADKVGISDAAIGNYERGEREPSFEIEEALADYFNVSILTLRGFNDDPETVKLLSHFEALNQMGRAEALKRVEELTFFPAYRKEK
jgi:transcriptional regulator with XRE-family HTH domain